MTNFDKNQFQRLRQMMNLSPDQAERDVNPQNDNIFQKLWDAKVVIVITLFAIFLRACYNDPQPRVINASEVAEETEELVGETVTVISRPQEQIGLSSFTISDRRLFGGEPIVVINASGAPFDLPAEQNIPVQITGRVRNLIVSEVERDFSLNIEDEYYRDFEDKPALIAEYITLAPTPTQVTQNPGSYYGQRLIIRGKVEDIKSPVLFSVNEDQLLFDTGNLLVLLNATPTVAINEGDTVALTGVLRPFVVAEIDREYKLNWGLKVRQQLEAEYNNRPVFIAESVSPL